MQDTENGTTHALTRCSYNLKETITKKSRKLLLCMTDPYKALPVTDSTITTDNMESLIP